MIFGWGLILLMAGAFFSHCIEDEDGMPYLLAGSAELLGALLMAASIIVLCFRYLP